MSLFEFNILFTKREEGREKEGERGEREGEREERGREREGDRERYMVISAPN